MVERRQSEKTSFVLGREDENTGSPITDRTQIVKRRYVVTAWNTRREFGKGTERFAARRACGCLR